MKALKTVLMLALTLVLATGAVAEDAKKGEKGKAAAAKKDGAAKRGERKAPGVTARLVGKLDLSAEQKEKVAAIDKEFAAKAAEIQKASDAVLTKEQIEARNAAMKSARASKDKSPEARKAAMKSVQDAVKLTDDQKKKMAEVNKSRQELNGKVLAALKNVLTEEQQKSLPKAGRGEGGKGKKPEGARKPAGDKKKKGDAKKDAAE
jgi:Spy/CpxP family protein refolding chaperone